MCEVHVLAWNFADPADVDAQLATLSATGGVREALRSFGVLVALMRDLVLVDLGRLGLPNSRNHARVVQTHDRQRMVLKLTVVVEGDETGALLAWQRHGLAPAVSARIHAHGTTDDGYQWSVQEFVEGSPVRVDDPRHAVSLACALAERLHIPHTSLPDACEHLDRRLALWSSCAHREVAAVARELRKALVKHLPTAERVVVHGDFTAAHLIATPDSTRIIDPVGLSGPGYFDSARFVSRSTPHIPVAPRLRAVAADHNLPTDGFSLVAACELLDVTVWSLDTGGGERSIEDMLDDVRSCARDVG